MEKTLGKPSLPKTDSIEKFARFWDAHDVTDFAEELEEVKEPVFVRKRNVVLKVTPPGCWKRSCQLSDGCCAMFNVLVSTTKWPNGPNIRFGHLVV